MTLPPESPVRVALELAAAAEAATTRVLAVWAEPHAATQRLVAALDASRRAHADRRAAYLRLTDAERKAYWRGRAARRSN